MGNKLSAEEENKMYENIADFVRKEIEKSTEDIQMKLDQYEKEKKEAAKNFQALQNRVTKQENVVQKTRDSLARELGRVENIQRMFNKIIVSYHEKGTEQKLQAGIHQLRNDNDAFKNSLNTRIATMEREIKIIEKDLEKIRDIAIRVKMEGGGVITFHMRPTDTVAKLKDTIMESEGIPPERQSLLFGHTPLKDNGCTLYSCGLGKTSIIKLHVMESNRH